MLIQGKAELISGMGIIRTLDITFRFGRDQFKDGHREWETMTFNGKRHLAFPLVPTARSYANLNGYFGKLQSSKIEVS